MTEGKLQHWQNQGKITRSTFCFLHPTTLSQWKRRCIIYTGTLMPVCSLHNI